MEEVSYWRGMYITEARESFRRYLRKMYHLHIARSCKLLTALLFTFKYSTNSRGLHDFDKTYAKNMK